MKQHGLYQRVNKIATKALLSSFVERLLYEKKYLGVCIGNLALLKAYYCLLQRQSRETNSNIYFCLYSSINNQINS